MAAPKGGGPSGAARASVQPPRRQERDGTGVSEGGTEEGAAQSVSGVRTGRRPERDERRPRAVALPCRQASCAASGRELCRLARGKWEVAGVLAPLDAADLERILAALCGRHLVLRESDQS